MPEVKLSHTSALILRIIDSGRLYGFDIMEATGLPSGTIYPALRRLEQLELIRSKWENAKKALKDQRPARKYYTLTSLGEELLHKAVERYPLLQHVKDKV